MTSVTATNARQRWAETLGRANVSPVRISSHGRDVAVVMNADLADRALEALQDAEDAADARASLNEPEPRISLSELAAELGIPLND